MTKLLIIKGFEIPYPQLDIRLDNISKIETIFFSCNVTALILYQMILQ